MREFLERDLSGGGVMRDLDTTKDYLFVLDGAKALRSAVARCTGSSPTKDKVFSSKLT